MGDASAFAIARVAFMLFGVVNTMLVALVAGRVGRREALCAASLYAVWEVGAIVERTTWLIAPQNTLLLLALLVLGARDGRPTPEAIGTRRLAAAGALLGCAVGVQLWEAVPFAVVLGWIVLGARHERRGWLRPAIAYVGAGAAAFGAIACRSSCLPDRRCSGTSSSTRWIALDASRS